MASSIHYCEGCIRLNQAERLIQNLLYSLQQQQNSALQITQMLQEQQRQLDAVRLAVDRTISATQVEILGRVSEINPKGGETA